MGSELGELPDLMTSPASEPDLSYLVLGDGQRIAIRHRVAQAGQPTILFLPGYASDMAGLKATAIDQFCAAQGFGCLWLDYSGTGQSAGEFAEGTLERWLDEVLAVIDRAAPAERLIVAGSSMGGWIALLAALRRPDRVAALLGIAAAPDFTDWGYSADDKAALLRDGRLEQFNPDGPGSSITHRGFWQSGEALRLLDAPIELSIPVRLIHGVDDGTVPITVPLKLVEQIASPDVQLRLIKSGGHNLSGPHEIDAILRELGDLAALVDLSRPLTTSGMAFDKKDRPVTQFLHSMLRVSDPQATIDFFRLIGLEERRRKDVPQGKFTLIFLGAGDDVAEVELTHNWDESGYDGGRNFGHLAFRVDDIYATCRALAEAGVTINRPPRDGHMAFVRSPDGISVELLQKGDALSPAEPWASMPNSGEW